jgi:hypothetical protein
MTPPLHLIIDGAGFEGCTARLADRPGLARLLKRLSVQAFTPTQEDSPETPFERARAQALCLPGEPGRVPWAAWEAADTTQPCAWLHLCHWQVGMDQVQVLDPRALAITAEESDALRAAVEPWLRDDGLELESVRPGVWHARGEVLRDLVCVSLDRVIGRTVSRDLLQAHGTTPTALVRLLNEVQMLFYAHPVTDARMAQRRLAPNALWITGAGALSALPPAALPLRIDTTLAAAMLGGGVQAHAAAWPEVEAGPLAELTRSLDTGHAVQLTLCGPRAACHFSTPAPGGWLDRLGRRLRARRPNFELDRL